jgi:hypothetical protein
MSKFLLFYQYFNFYIWLIIQQFCLLYRIFGFLSNILFTLVLGVIDWVGRPDSRSRPKSGRDPDFSGVVTGTRVATRIFFSLWVATQSEKTRKSWENEITNSIRQDSKKFRVATGWVTTRARIVTQIFSGYDPDPIATPNTRKAQKLSRNVHKRTGTLDDPKRSYCTTWTVWNVCKITVTVSSRSRFNKERITVLDSS